MPKSATSIPKLTITTWRRFAPHRLLDSRRDFTAPVEEGDLRQITDSPARDRNVAYSPDGKWLAFVSDRSGREELYVIAVDGAGEPQKLTDIDALKTRFHLVARLERDCFHASDSKLRKINVDSKQMPNWIRRSTATSRRPTGRPTANGSPIRSPTASRTVTFT